MLKDDFSAYVALPPTTPLSFIHFSLLRLKDSPSTLTSCPAVLPPGSVLSLSFARTEPITPEAFTLSHKDYVPHAEDLSKYALEEAHLRAKYAEGFRSLRITYREPGSDSFKKTKVIHFGQVSYLYSPFVIKPHVPTDSIDQID
jgi:hypothetical protein